MKLPELVTSFSECLCQHDHWGNEEGHVFRSQSKFLKMQKKYDKNGNRN